MTRNQAKNILPQFIAFANGSQMQLKNLGDKWQDADRIDFECDPSRLRVKPEPREWWIFTNLNSGGSVSQKKISTTPIVAHDYCHVIHVREVLD